MQTQKFDLLGQTVTNRLLPFVYLHKICAKLTIQHIHENLLLMYLQSDLCWRYKCENTTYKFPQCKIDKLFYFMNYCVWWRSFSDAFVRQKNKQNPFTIQNLNSIHFQSKLACKY